MPEIPSIRIPQVRQIPPLNNIPQAPSVTLELGFPIIDMPGCVAVHPDAKLNPSLLRDDPARTGYACPEGQIPSFEPMDFTANELRFTEPKAPANTNEDEDSQPSTPQLPTVPRLPRADEAPAQTTAQPQPEAPFIKQALDGLPDVGSVVTTTTIAVVATTSALVAKPLAELILKTIKPTVKKVMKKLETARGQTVAVESVWERRLAQRDRNRAILALRRALKP
jgi:hypothetical protein